MCVVHMKKNFVCREATARGLARAHGLVMTYRSAPFSPATRSLTLSSGQTKIVAKLVSYITHVDSSRTVYCGGGKKQMTSGPWCWASPSPSRSCIQPTEHFPERSDNNEKLEAGGKSLRDKVGCREPETILSTPRHTTPSHRSSASVMACRGRCMRRSRGDGSGRQAASLRAGKSLRCTGGVGWDAAETRACMPLGMSRPIIISHQTRKELIILFTSWQA
jgi:hypothetical protein